MCSELKISVVVENSVYKQALLAEHGLSVLIECGTEKILMDTGQGKALFNNLTVMNISLDDIHKLILSHSHYDHTGGVMNFLMKKSTPTEIYIHPEAMKPCFSKRNGTVRPIGLSEPVIDMFENGDYDIRFTEKPTEVYSNVWVTGSVPRMEKYPMTDRFYSDGNAAVENIIPDDQTTFIETEKGIVVIAGCCHAGIIPTLEYIKSLTDNSVYAVIGGMHLIHASREQQEEVLDYLVDNGVQIIAPLHCSGFDAKALFKERLGDKYLNLYAGATFSF